MTALLDTDALREFMLRQRWFGGKARAVAAMTVIDQGAVDPGTWLAVVELRYEDGGSDCYLVPIACEDLGAGAAADRYPETAVIARTGNRILSDGLFHDGFCRSLLALACRGGEVRTRRGVLRGPAAICDEDPVTGAEPIQRTAPDQSNTSVIFGSALILKLFRRMEPGINPDVELSTFLTRRGFPHVPPVRGTVEYVMDGREPAAAVMVQRFVSNRGNGWKVTLAALERYLADHAAPPEHHVDLPALLGRRTGEMHVALASGSENQLRAERFTPEQLAGEVRRMREDAERQLRLLDTSRDTLDPSVVRRADTVLAARERIGNAFEPLRELAGAAWRIRLHGDYHLGQTLVTNEDVVILDFEGEPARSLAERRSKSSPLRDVAGMLRSFSYAVCSAVRAQAATRAGDSREIDSRARKWEAVARSRFLQAYQEATEGAPFVPRARSAFDVLLRAYTLDKALYELGYELNNRPEWVAFPLDGILQLADIK